MARTMEKLGVSTIPSTDTPGSTIGSTVRAGPHMLGIVGPSDPLTGNVYLEASIDDGASWQRVSVYGADIQLLANRMVLVDGVPAPLLRATSDSNEMADRDFVFWAIMQV